MTSSRIFGIKVDGVDTGAFVPYADMLNHRWPKQTSWFYDEKRNGFVIEACDDIKRGEQIYDSYGRKSNAKFFMNYGFVNIPNDHYDEIMIKLRVGPE